MLQEVQEIAGIGACFAGAQMLPSFGRHEGSRLNAILARVVACTVTLRVAIRTIS
jgi:hypothetical protein